MERFPSGERFILRVEREVSHPGRPLSFSPVTKSVVYAAEPVLRVCYREVHTRVYIPGCTYRGVPRRVYTGIYTTLPYPGSIYGIYTTLPTTRSTVGQYCSPFRKPLLRRNVENYSFDQKTLEWSTISDLFVKMVKTGRKVGGSLPSRLPLSSMPDYQLLVKRCPTMGPGPEY